MSGRKDSLRAMAEAIAKELHKQPRSAWPGLIAVALSGFQERVKDRTIRAVCRLERAGRREAGK